VGRQRCFDRTTWVRQPDEGNKQRVDYIEERTRKKEKFLIWGGTVGYPITRLSRFRQGEKCDTRRPGERKYCQMLDLGKEGPTEQA